MPAQHECVANAGGQVGGRKIPGQRWKEVPDNHQVTPNNSSLYLRPTGSRSLELPARILAI